MYGQTNGNLLLKTQDAFNCYTKRFGEENSSNIDIFKVDKKTIPDHTLLVGGFPCQNYSVAQTLSNSKGIEGKKESFGGQ